MSVVHTTNMSTPIRYFVLLLILIYGIGFMGVNDTPASLQHAIMTSFNLDAFQFSLIFSLTSCPSIFGFINGFIIDRYLGVRLATIIYGCMLTIGNIMFLVGSYTFNFNLLIIGRIFYGFGADPMMLCINAFILHWFASTDELNMVFSMITSLPWAGSSVAFFMSNRIYEYAKRVYPLDQALGIAVSASMAFTVAMTISCIVLTIMYRPITPNKIKCEIPSDNLKSDLMMPDWKSTLKFPFIFWLFSLLINLYFLAVTTFLMFSQEFFAKRYKMSFDAASNMSSAFSLVTCVLSSPLGFLIDRTGRNLVFISMSVGFGLISHGMMAFTTSNPFAAVVILSLSYSMMTSSYLPVISNLVEKHQTATAYGIAQSGVNGAFAFGSLIVGRIISSYGYEIAEKFYFILIGSTVPFWILVWIINIKQGNKLNMSTKQKMYSDSLNGNISTEMRTKTLVADPPGMTTPPALRKGQIEVSGTANGVH